MAADPMMTWLARSGVPRWLADVASWVGHAAQAVVIFVACESTVHVLYDRHFTLPEAVLLSIGLVWAALLREHTQRQKDGLDPYRIWRWGFDATMDWILVAAALAGLVLLMGVQPAKAQGGCTPLPIVLAQAEAQGLTAEAFRGRDIERAVAFFNRIPPASDEAFDLALVVVLPDGSGVLAVGRNGGVCGQVRLPPEGLRAMTNIVKGRGI